MDEYLIHIHQAIISSITNMCTQIPLSIQFLVWFQKHCYNEGFAYIDVML